MAQLFSPPTPLDRRRTAYLRDQGELGSRIDAARHRIAAAAQRHEVIRRHQATVLRFLEGSEAFAGELADLPDRRGKLTALEA